MKRVLTGALLLAGASLLGGCVVAPVVPPIGIAYTNFQAPLQTGFNDTKVSSKSGSSESMSILGLVSLGDASTKAAADNGGVKTITHADYEFFNVLGVYQRYRTVVYGD